MLSSHVGGKASRGGMAKDRNNRIFQTKLPRASSATPAAFSAITQHDASQKNATPSATSTRSIGELIIGVDIGTTQVAVATAERLYAKDPNRPAPKIKLYNGWLGFYMNRSETPSTAMYYNEDGSAITGNTLQRLINNADPTAYDPDHLIRLWKFMFHHHQGDSRMIDIQSRTQEQLRLLGHKTHTDLLKDWVGILFDQLFIDGKGVSSLRQTYKNFDNLDLKVVVAVPPGRETIAHAEVLQAFVQGPITSTDVSLESEPAALFRAWVQENEDEEDWVVGKRYLVVDGGGGTCCFTRFRLDSLHPLRFGQEFSSESLVCGAETISDLFESLMARKLPRDCDNRAWHIARARNMFDEQYKIYFGSEESTPAPAFLKPGARSDADFIPVTVAEVEACFTPCATKVNGEIRRQQGLGEPVDYLVLGGGLFQNLYILNNIRKEFRDLKLLEMSKFKGAVAKGSVQSMLDGDEFISTFPVARTKAVAVWMEVDAKMKRSKMYNFLKTRKSPYNNIEYFKAALYLAKQGDQSAAEQDYSTEKSAEDAMKIYITLGDKDLVFSERILTFNYRPGKDQWAALSNDEEGSWMNMQGKQIPHPEHSEMITWSPFAEDNEIEVDPEDFDTEEHGGEVRAVLRYSIQMKVKETWTKYWAKIWSSEKRKKRTGSDLWILSMPVEREPLFTPQAISQSLKDSFDLDSADDTQSSSPGVTALSNAAQPSRPELRAPEAVMTAAQQPRIPVSTSATREIPLPPKTIPRIWNTAEQRQVTGSAATSTLPTQKESNLGPVIIARPLQQQRTEAGAGYSIGAGRNTGGCWTCLFRHYDCSKEKPICNKCERFGLECNYGRPSWWYDPKLRAEQQAKNKQLVKLNKERKNAGLPSGKKPYPRTMRKTPPVQGFQESSIRVLNLQRGTTDSPLLAQPNGPDQSIPSIETPKRPRDHLDKSGEMPKLKIPRPEPPASLSRKDPDRPIPSIETSKRPRHPSDEGSNTLQSKRLRLSDLLPRSSSSRRPGDAHRRKSDRPRVERVALAEMRSSGDISDDGIENGTWFREDSQDGDFVQEE
ncbi:hypothetical protein BDZ45DRAFT_670808 [Acephala macrosclerotiorum]|nr:hypothetical protein BDZ45DRAFT_670808 [Acephala macrosclerotiorum]